MTVRYNHRRGKVLPVDMCQRDGIENAKRICQDLRRRPRPAMTLLREALRQDYADSMDLRQGGSRRGERVTHLPLVGFDFRVDATQIGEELLGEIAGQALVAVVGLICRNAAAALSADNPSGAPPGVDARTTAAELSSDLCDGPRVILCGATRKALPRRRRRDRSCGLLRY